MPFHVTASAQGPWDHLAEQLALPVALHIQADNAAHLYSLASTGEDPAPLTAWGVLPGGATELPAGLDLDSLDAWRPGMTVLLERQTRLHTTIQSEVSALWTGFTPRPTGLAGHIGLDLDLGINATASIAVEGALWWAITRPSPARQIVVRLAGARSAARSLQVNAIAHGGLDGATQRALAAILDRRREEWTGLLPESDALTARLEFAAVRLLERQWEATLGVQLDGNRASQVLVEATFDFDAGAAVPTLFQQVLRGKTNALFGAPVPGIRLSRGVLVTEQTDRRTFQWQIPFTAGFLSTGKRLRTALEALDDQSGRTLTVRASSESSRTTRRAASLLQLEGALAVSLSKDVVVHGSSPLEAQLEWTVRAGDPHALAPLLRLYGLTPPPGANRLDCNLQVRVRAAALATWFQPQEPAEVSRRLQRAWRALLPAVVDRQRLAPANLAPLWVWAALPVCTNARRTATGLVMDDPPATYWDWPSRRLREAMVWNPRTRAALDRQLVLEARPVTPDELRRQVATPAGEAVFQSLLHTEALLIEAVVALPRLGRPDERDPVGMLRDFSHWLAGITDAFHARLTSLYGADAARALGPLLLASGGTAAPEAEVKWSL